MTLLIGESALLCAFQSLNCPASRTHMVLRGLQSTNIQRLGVDFLYALRSLIKYLLMFMTRYVDEVQDNLIIDNFREIAQLYGNASLTGPFVSPAAGL